MADTADRSKPLSGGIDTHNAAEAERLARQMVHLESGRVTRIESADPIMTDPGRTA